jgi:hypothetical protein
MSFGPEVAQAPDYLAGRPAVVVYRAEVVFFDWLDGGGRRCFAEVADVWKGNCKEPYLLHATSTAATKAEARMWGKALRLRGVTAEEMVPLPPAAGPDEKADGAQLLFLDLLARELDVDVLKFVNLRNGGYKSARAVPYAEMAGMLEGLQTWRNNPNKVLAEVRGYDSNWKEQK